MTMDVVLYQPEIPWNTGNIGRTCVAAGAPLHLIEPLGFSLSERQIRRSGLDYWPRLALRRHADADAFWESLPPGAAVLAFSSQAAETFWDAPYERDSFLLFGGESRGLPEAVLKRCRGVYSIPVRPGIRSLNLSTAAGIALYEGLRRAGGNKSVTDAG